MLIWRFTLVLKVLRNLTQMILMLLMAYLSCWVHYASHKLHSISDVALWYSFAIHRSYIWAAIHVLLLFPSLFRALRQGLGLASSLPRLHSMTFAQYFGFKRALQSFEIHFLNCFLSTWLIQLGSLNKWEFSRNFLATCLSSEALLPSGEDRSQLRGPVLFQQRHVCSLVLVVRICNLPQLLK